MKLQLIYLLIVLTSSLNEEPFSPSSNLLSISSPINEKSNYKQLQNEFWRNFQIPWHYLEPTVTNI